MLPADHDWLSVVLGTRPAAAVDHSREDHHDEADPLPTVTGTVTAVSVVRCRYGPVEGSRVRYPVDGSGTVAPVGPLDWADGSDADHGSTVLAGYLVRVEGDLRAAGPGGRSRPTTIGRFFSRKD